MTKAEVLLWLRLKNKKILGQRFLRQYGILSYVVDFYCPQLRLAIEVDGVTHTTDTQRKHDQRRQREFKKLGIEILRFTNPEVYSDMTQVLHAITEKGKQRI